MTKNIIQRGRVSLIGLDLDDVPITQVTGYDQPDDAAVIWPYGMHGNLPINSTTVTFLLNGQSENRAVIGYRPDLRQKGLKEGEVIFGNFLKGSTTFYDDEGNIVVNCEKDEKVTIKGASVINIEGDADINVGGNTTLTTPLATIDGDVVITGDLTVQKDTTLGANVTSNGKDISDTSTHSGVTPGVGVSGPVV